MAKKNLRRDEKAGYEFKDGKKYGGYKVYDDGRVFLHNGMAEAYESLDTDAQALHQFKTWMANYAYERERELQARVKRFWNDLRDELQIVYPLDDPSQFTLEFNKTTREAIRKPKPPEPPAEPEDH